MAGCRLGRCVGAIYASYVLMTKKKEKDERDREGRSRVNTHLRFVPRAVLITCSSITQTFGSKAAVTLKVCRTRSQSPAIPTSPCLSGLEALDAKLEARYERK